jgi:type IV pilus assembly protein PilC
MIKIGEESGTLDAILEKTAEFYDGEVDTTISRLNTMLEPLIIVVLGGVVAFIVIAIILPVFEVYNTMS